MCVALCKCSSSLSLQGVVMKVRDYSVLHGVQNGRKPEIMRREGESCYLYTCNVLLYCSYGILHECLRII